VTSGSRKLTVKLPPSITTQPSNISVKTGRTAKFAVKATGKTPLTYQWTKNDAEIAGATNSFYTRPPTTTDDNGAIFAVTVTNSLGNVTSDNATLTVRYPHRRLAGSAIG
jgi:hypothetical protein